MAAMGLKAECRLGWFPPGGSRGNYFLPVQLLEASALLSPTSASISVSLPPPPILPPPSAKDLEGTLPPPRSPVAQDHPLVSG